MALGTGIGTFLSKMGREFGDAESSKSLIERTADIWKKSFWNDESTTLQNVAGAGVIGAGAWGVGQVANASQDSPVLGIGALAAGGVLAMNRPGMVKSWFSHEGAIAEKLVTGGGI